MHSNCIKRHLVWSFAYLISFDVSSQNWMRSWNRDVLRDKNIFYNTTSKCYSCIWRRTFQKLCDVLERILPLSSYRKSSSENIRDFANHLVSKHSNVIDITHLSLVPQWTRSLLVRVMACRLFCAKPLREHWLIVNYTLRNKRQWNSNENAYLSFMKTEFENVVYELAAIFVQWEKSYIFSAYVLNKAHAAVWDQVHSWEVITYSVPKEYIVAFSPMSRPQIFLWPYPCVSYQFWYS